jgi:hypothetical protein
MSIARRSEKDISAKEEAHQHSYDSSYRKFAMIAQ